MSSVFERVTDLPYGLAGSVLRSVMPFSDFDAAGAVWKAYRERGVGTVVVLAGREECLGHTGMDLFAFYRDEGMEVISVPIADHSTPADRAKLEAAVEQVWRKARDGSAIAIHCYAGIGRTGIFAALLARRALGLDGPAAVVWIRRWVPGALETEGQRATVIGWPPAEPPGP